MDWWAWWIGFSASGNFCSVVVAALKNLDHERAAIIHHRGEAGTWIRVSSAGATSRVTYAFHGLFGIGSNEIIMVTSWGLDHDPVAELSLPDNVKRVEEVVLVPTVRPARDQQLTRPGLYVVRFFDVRNADVEEIAELSQTAWSTFEDTSEYAAEPQGLFCQKDRASERGVMLLLTWYDGLSSWQTSRRPHPDATANFRHRHELTFGTIAYATRLIAS